MVEEERNHMDQILKQIQKLEQEKHSLIKELGKRHLADEDKYINSQLTFLAILRDLNEEVEGFRKEKEERMVEVYSNKFRFNSVINIKFSPFR